MATLSEFAGVDRSTVEPASLKARLKLKCWTARARWKPSTVCRTMYF